MAKQSVLAFCICALVALTAWAPQAQARSSFWAGQGGCSNCHTDDTTTCAGCHAHGVHSANSKNDINVAATTDSTVYGPGDTVTVSVTGGYRSGWVRAILYDENMVEADRSQGPGCGDSGSPDNGCGGGAEFPGPIVLQATAPSASGIYTFNASWYGNQYDLGQVGGTTTFGNWVPDLDNCFQLPSGEDVCHGEEIVMTNAFEVVVQAMLRCDLNDNGEVDAGDLSQVGRMVLGNIADDLDCDINNSGIGDGVISIADLVIASQIVLGIIPEIYN